jgi:hypothetical protein
MENGIPKMEEKEAQGYPPPAQYSDKYKFFMVLRAISVAKKVCFLPFTPCFVANFERQFWP